MALLSVDNFVRGTRVLRNPNSASLKKVFKGLGYLIEDAVVGIDPATLVEIGSLSLKIREMYQAQHSTHGKVFRILNDLQPGANPIVDLAYAVVETQNKPAADVVKAGVRAARVVASHYAPAPPSTSEFQQVATEIAHLGIQVVVGNKKHSEVAPIPHLRLV